MPHHYSNTDFVWRRKYHRIYFYHPQYFLYRRNAEGTQYIEKAVDQWFCDILSSLLQHSLKCDTLDNTIYEKKSLTVQILMFRNEIKAEFSFVVCWNSRTV